MRCGSAPHAYTLHTHTRTVPSLFTVHMIMIITTRVKSCPPLPPLPPPSFPFFLPSSPLSSFLFSFSLSADSGKNCPVFSHEVSAVQGCPIPSKATSFVVAHLPQTTKSNVKFNLSALRVIISRTTHRDSRPTRAPQTGAAEHRRTSVPGLITSCCPVTP